MAQVVDPSLIGGFRLDIGEESIDTSIRTDIAMARLAMAK
jgi:F0F1-type ATP synthase delta subunit